MNDLTIRIPAPLRACAGGCAEVRVRGASVADALRELTDAHPRLRRQLYTDGGELRSYVNLFRNEDDVRTLEGERTPVAPGDVITILPSIAGG